MGEMPKTAILHAPLLADTAFSEQRELERQMVDLGVDDYRSQISRLYSKGDGSETPGARTLAQHWIAHIKRAVVRRKAAWRKGEVSGGLAFAGPFLEKLPADVIALIAITETLNRTMEEPTGSPWTGTCHAIGRGVIAEINTRLSRKEKTEITYRDPDKPAKIITKRTALERRFKKLRPVHINWWSKQNLNDAVWSAQACVQIGNLLLWDMVASTKIPMADGEQAEAFRRFRRVEGKKAPFFVSLSNESVSAIESIHAIRATMHPRYRPTICAPMPWQAELGDDGRPKGKMVEGGYLTIRPALISGMRAVHRRALSDSLLAGELHEFLDCFNAVQETQLGIDGRMLDIAKELVASGQPVAGLPGRHVDEKPPRPAEGDLVEWRRACSQWHRRQIERAAECESVDAAVADAEWGKDRERLGFPLNVDFRGRSYPLPARLNHQGDDFRRGLLRFADAKPTDSVDATFWLAVQVAGMAGHDKLSLSDRAEWTAGNHAAIRRIAKDPLGTVDDWSREPGGKPRKSAWQYLAACIAWCDPSAAARLPVGIDGTCNGLQWFAALGRNRIEAQAVNLTPSTIHDTPADVYKLVLSPALDIVTRDALAGNELARMVAGIMDRDIVKQPIMTTSYDVTPVGMRDQILNTLRKRGVEGDDLYAAATYIRDVIQEAMGDVCASARRIMDWLKECTALIVKKRRQVVQWKTPIGFPVVQGYFNTSEHRIRTAWCDMVLKVQVEEMGPHTKDQLQGISPNYIHSLDATHCLITGRRSLRAGHAFIATHDRYLTHAASVRPLGGFTREEFAKLVSRNLLGELREQWVKRYGILLPMEPEQGDWNPGEVLESMNFFS